MTKKILHPSPLSGPPPEEVPLKNAPLVRVIAQVRFPPILSISDSSKVAAFQEIIRSAYPILEEEHVHHILMLPSGSGVPEVKKDHIWRFNDQERNWCVSLHTGFVSLEAKKYTSRKDLLERFAGVLTGIENIFVPSEAQRVGLRYVDRLTGSAIDNISSMIREEVLGIARSEISRSAQHILTEALLSASEGDIQARWGSLSEGATFDPSALEPIDAKSWVLDLDMFSTTPQPFKAKTLLDTTTGFSERVYSVFRWMVTDNFLKHYGGKP